MIRISSRDIKVALHGNKMTSNQIEEAIRKAKRIPKDEWDEISPPPFLAIARVLHKLIEEYEVETDNQGGIEYSLGSKGRELAMDEIKSDNEEEIDDPNHIPTTK